MILITNPGVLAIELGIPDADDYPRIYWRNAVTTASLTADYATAAGPVLNLLNPATNLRWISSSTDDQYIYVTFAEATEIDYVAIAAATLGSCGCYWQLEYSVDAGVTWTPLGSLAAAPADDSAIITEYDVIFARWYRLRIVDATDAPTIGVLQIGMKTVLSRKIYVGHTPIVFDRDTTVSTGRSESGSFLGRILRREFISAKVEQKNVAPAFYRTSIDPFVEHARTGAFFFAWRPSSYPQEVAYCWLTKDAEVSNQRANGMMQYSLTMQGIP